jgi:hypothetical protein
MRLRSRLLRLERHKATIASPDYCPLCGSGPVQQIPIYHLEPDGTERLMHGTAPVPCPRCGRVGRKGEITGIVIVYPRARRPGEPAPPFITVESGE